MRTEKEMFDLILGAAKADDRIQTVLMVGSRADPNDLSWGQNADYSRSYGWLMLFKDGNRIVI